MGGNTIGGRIESLFLINMYKLLSNLEEEVSWFGDV